MHSKIASKGVVLKGALRGEAGADEPIENLERKAGLVRVNHSERGRVEQRELVAFTPPGRERVLLSERGWSATSNPSNMCENLAASGEASRSGRSMSSRMAERTDAPPFSSAEFKGVSDLKASHER